MKTKHIVSLIGIGAGLVGTAITSFFAGRNDGASNLANLIINQAGDIEVHIDGNISESSPDEIAEAFGKEYSDLQEIINQLKKECYCSAQLSPD